jgi:multidrug efflux pump subunit AcrA (membrane-fusion protein)
MTWSSLKTVFTLALSFSLVWGCRGGSVDEIADGHTEVDGHGEVRVVHLEPAALEQVGIEVAVAGPGDLDVTTELPGEVQVNGDRMAHISPRVGGVVKEVHASLGDTVRAGQLLAVLESSELADAKAAFLAATERLRLANATFDREERLFHSSCEPPGRSSGPWVSPKPSWMRFRTSTILS